MSWPWADALSWLVWLVDGVQEDALEAAQVDPSVCAECELKQATTHCSKCDQDFCTDCANRIHSKALQSHKQHFTPASSKPKKPASLGSCLTHGDPLRVWCRTDEQVICGLCLFDKHKGHSTDLVESVFEEELGKITAAQTSAAALKA